MGPVFWCRSLQTGLLKELRDRRLVDGAIPTREAHTLVMQSPYAPYVSAIREVSKR